ncbi:MAG: hypothetical protein Q7R69_03495 [bacterium]|nr:hypothetical protein [bacterium]
MKKVILVTLALVPAFAFAQTLGNITILFNSIKGLVALALPIVVGLALLAFFWGLVKFIFAQGDEASKTEAKKIMLWGLIALFVMVSVWGLVRFIGTNLGITDNSNIQPPGIIGL